MDIRKDYVDLAKDLIHSIYSLRKIVNYYEENKNDAYSVAAQKNFMVNLYVIGPALDGLLKLEELKEYHEDLETMKKQFNELKRQCDDKKVAFGLVASH